MNWFYLALLAPLLYAIVNLVDDNLLQFVYESPLTATAMAGIFGSLPLLSRFWVHADAIRLSLALPMILSGFLLTVFFYFYFRALDIDHPSVVAAILNLVPATLPLFAYIFLKEYLANVQLIGFLVVMTAALLMSAIDIKRFKFSKAIIPILIAVVVADVSAILSKYVYNNAPFYSAYLYYTAGIGIGGIYFFYMMLYTDRAAEVRSLRKLIGKMLPVFLLMELVNLGAEFTSNLAVSKGPVSLVMVISGIQPAFILLFSFSLYPLAPKFFSEAEAGQKFKKFSLIAAMAAGLFLIAR